MAALARWVVLTLLISVVLFLLARQLAPPPHKEPKHHKKPKHSKEDPDRPIEVDVPPSHTEPEPRNVKPPKVQKAPKEPKEPKSVSLPPPPRRDEKKVPPPELPDGDTPVKVLPAGTSTTSNQPKGGSSGCGVRYADDARIGGFGAIVDKLSKDVFQVSELKDTTFWVNGSVWSGGQMIDPPNNARIFDVYGIVPKPDATEMQFLGRYSTPALLWCEFWTITWAMFLFDCLPRLLVGFSRLSKEQQKEVKILAPGEHFVTQFLVEVLGFSEDRITVLPANLIWWLRYPTYYLEYDHLLRVEPMRGDDAFAVLGVAVPVLRAAVYGQRECWPKLNDLLTQHYNVLGDDATSAPPDPRDKTTVMRRSPPNVTMAGIRNGMEGPFVVFSERSDIMMPAEHLDTWNGVQSGVGDAAQLLSVRMETQRVLTQLQLATTATLMVGPAGHNLANAVFMRPEARVVLLWGNVTDDHYDLKFVRRLGELVGLSVDLVRASSPMDYKKQPKYETAALTESIKTSLGQANADKLHSEPTRGSVWLSPPYLGCEKLFHLSKNPHQMGAFKQTYIVSNRFALKVARTGDWKRVLKEMVILRNLTEDIIAPPVAMCFHKHFSINYAQTLVYQLGKQGQTETVPYDDAPTFYLAVAGYLRAWNGHLQRGRFLFYCDPGPKNWGISKYYPQRMQMYDFDSSTQIQPGALCAIEEDCYCGGVRPKKPTPLVACKNHTCTFQGMQEKIDMQVHGWLGSSIRSMIPGELKKDEDTRTLTKAIGRAGPIACQPIVDYLKIKAPDVAATLPDTVCRQKFISPQGE